MIISKKQFDAIIEYTERPFGQFSIDGQSLYDLGYIFENGLFEENKTVIEIDLERSYHWYNLAMAKGSVDAIIRVADFLSEGVGCEKNIDKAIFLYLSSIEKGLSIASFNLATVYRDLNNYDEAFKYYSLGEELMSKEYKRTTYSLNTIMCYLYGVGTQKDIEKALTRLEYFVNQGNNYSCQYDIDEANYILGSLYLQGIEIPQNINKARSYLLKADQDQDHRSAQELLLLIGRK